MPKKRSENRKRQKQRSVRLDEAEFALTEALAQRAGLQWSSWARQALLNAPAARARPVPCIEAQALGHVLGSMGRIGSNVFQLLKAARFGDQFAETEVRPVLADIRAVCRAIMEAMGRQP